MIAIFYFLYILSYCNAISCKDEFFDSITQCINMQHQLNVYAQRNVIMIRSTKLALTILNQFPPQS